MAVLPSPALLFTPKPCFQSGAWRRWRTSSGWRAWRLTSARPLKHSPEATPVRTPNLCCVAKSGRCTAALGEHPRLALTSARPSNNPPENTLPVPCCVAKSGRCMAALGEHPRLALTSARPSNNPPENTLPVTCCVAKSGRCMAALGEHPRLARLALTSAALGCEALGCMLAALISEGDFLRGPSGTADVRARLRILIDPSANPGQPRLLFSACMRWRCHKQGPEPQWSASFGSVSVQYRSVLCTCRLAPSGEVCRRIMGLIACIDI